MADLAHDLFDRGHEPEVEHLIGFIEHDDVGLIESCLTASNMVEESAGCGDNNVQPIGECLDLGHGTGTTDHEGHRGAHEFAVGANTVADLAGKFTGGGQNQGGETARPWARPFLSAEALGGKVMKDGQNERGGFAGARLCDANHVMTFDHGRNDLGLDGCGVGVAFGRDGTKQWFGKAEFSKCFQNSLS